MRTVDIQNICYIFRQCSLSKPYENLSKPSDVMVVSWSHLIFGWIQGAFKYVNGKNLVNNFI